jgi:predicted nucleic-acid-binding Zn-ribbon protein
MAIALTGAVIVEDSGNMITYRKKCQSCGYVEGGGNITTPPSRGTTMSSAFMCMKCRTMNEIRIQG